MPTFFAATLSAGFGIMAAYLVQGVAMLLAVAGVAWVWRRHTGLALRGSVLVLGTFLFTPYAQIYDLALLALPLCWLWEEGRIHGRLPGELLLLFIGWLMPLAEQILWNWINIFDGKLQIAPVIILALFFLSLVKAGRQWAGTRLISEVNPPGVFLQYTPFGVNRSRSLSASLPPVLDLSATIAPFGGAGVTRPPVLRCTPAHSTCLRLFWPLCVLA